MGMDVDSAPMNQLSVWFDANIWQFTQELRLQGETDSMNWVTGLYYMYAEYDNAIGFKAGTGSSLLLPPGTVEADYPAMVDQEVENISIFGQVDINLSDELVLTIGGRIISESKDFEYSLDVVTHGGDPWNFARGTNLGTFSDVVPGFPTSTEFEDDTSDILWAGKIQLDYHMNDDVLLYAGLNRGVKAGGFNSPIDFGGSQVGALPSSYDYEYDEEILYAYEMGFKTTIWDGAARFNGSVFYYDYNDYQGFVFAGVSGTVVNYDSTVLGAELELIASPIDGLDIILNVAAFDAEVEDVEVAPGVFEDTEPSYSPDFQAAALVRYGWDMFGGEMAVQVDANYSAEAWYTLRNYDSHEMDDYTLWNARVSWTSEDDAWQLAAFVDNFTDEQNEIMGFDISLFCGCSEIAVGKPRWWGVSRPC
jgi:iron complex outermembrane receptor protein